MAELEAARLGKFSEQRKRSSTEARKPKKTIFGWTAPLQGSRFSASGDSESHVLAAFCPPKHSNPALVVTSSPFFVLPKPIVLPPGYAPVFHPACIRGAMTETQADQIKPSIPEHASVTGTAFPPATAAVASKTTQLLKPFITDPAKQARFDAYQVLRRRGFTREYLICLLVCGFICFISSLSCSFYVVCFRR
ncbi:unnamed protein product [Dibothriocephalus latus]|uniref:Uncharacterized protein n=1 Tax=Dibothriocephalus latus TaxID=60516 RepID=A0A3P7QME3_DIBLA|nr:unnamed protein product [Dibothriocephalus latus]